LAGIGFGASFAPLLWGAVATTSSRRLPSAFVNGIGALVVAAAVFDTVHHTWIAPSTWVAAIALLPLAGAASVSSPAAVIGAVLAVSVVALALVGIGGNALEPLRRRSDLVSQLRFAASLQDTRVVVLLHRELAMEEPRRRPWIRLPMRDDVNHPVWRRGWHSFARWPARRFARVVVLVGVALALTSAARSTPLLMVLAGAASFVIALDFIEPFAAELDRPTMLLTHGEDIRGVLARNLAAPIAAVTGISLAVALGVAIVAPARAQLAFAAAISASLAALGGAVLNVVLGPPPAPKGAYVLVMPEVYGLILLLRQGLPLLLAAAGLAPIVLAASATTNGTQAGLTLAGVVVAAAVGAMSYSCLRGV
jgi:hypothetical protein